MGRVVTAAVALGSNLGDRAAHLAYAVERLPDLLSDIRVSSFHETDPVGVSPQPRFLNAAVVGTTGAGPRALLDGLRRIERARHRARPYPGAPRTLDLDLVLFGSEMVDEADLIVPHPRFRARLFVLGPLVEVGPDLVDPVTGLTVAALHARLLRAA